MPRSLDTYMATIICLNKCYPPVSSYLVEVGGLNALTNGLTKSTHPVSGFHYSPFPLGKRAACLPWAATCVGG